MLIFRNKLFFILISSIIVISCISITVMRNYNYDDKKNELFLSAQNQSYQIDNYISNLFSQMKNDDKFLADSPEVRKADRSIQALFTMDPAVTPKKYSKELPGIESEIYNVFERFGKTHLDTCYVYMGTVWGGYISYPDGLVVNEYDPRIRPWYIQAVNNPDKVTISDPYMDYSNSNNPLISASITIRDHNGNISGVMGLDVNLENLSNMIKNIKSAEGGYTFVFTKDGTIIAHPDNKLNFTKINANRIYLIKDFDKLTGEGDGNFRTAINNEEVLINMFTSSGTGWKIATVIPISRLTGEVDEITVFMIFITLCILATSALLLYLVSRKITEPISELTHLMQLAENGNLNVQADIKTRDEFRKLGDNFNSMIRKLDSNYQELSAVSEELAASEETIREQYYELEHNQITLRESEERYRLALDGSNDSIWEWDAEKDKFFISDMFYEITGIPQKDKHKLQRMFQVLVHPEDKRKTKHDFEKYLKTGTSFWQAEFRIKIKDQTYIWVYVKGKALKDSSGKTVKMAGSITDITQRKLSEEKILHMAHYDPLTLLPNRAYFMTKLKAEFNEALLNKTEAAVFFIDFNNFKNINDTLGHDFGDKLLKEVSVQLKKAVNTEDYVCRFGGDEFVILHLYREKEEVIRFADQLLDLFDKANEIEDMQIYISASIGIALYPKDGPDVSSILKNADAAMYKAKEHRSNRYAFYDEEIYLGLKRKIQIQGILRTAIQNRELSVYYQPQYHSVNHEIVGFEALLRLNSKELGSISPAEFIPIAEETGLINVLGKWVLEEACRQSYEWQQKGFCFNVMSVNISSAQLNNPDFFDMIIETVKSTKIHSSNLELEITETSLMQSIDSSINILGELEKRGVRIALDDFGTGYSSLNYLRKIPLTTLKVDKSFIDNICTNSKEEAIIKSIIEMAHSMHLEVVAEGVENEQQLITLKNIKCDTIQGYYFSKPLPPDEIEALMGV